MKAMKLIATAVIILVVLTIEYNGHFIECKCSEDGVIFTFGDSNSDTGGLTAGLGFPIPLPNGRVFFGRATGRLSDGRLILDFLCESLNMTYLNPYLDSLGTGFRNGANFAIGGSSTSPKFEPFSLYIQLLQFIRFRLHTSQLSAEGSCNVLNQQQFEKALYLIDIGQNDLAKAFAHNLTYDEVVHRTIPYALSEIKLALKTIYDTGGRNFWVHNTGPLGCLPQMLSVPRKNDKGFDSNGCILSLNNAAKEFNQGLTALCDEMRSKLKNATIVYTDIYTLKYDLIANHTKYGFKTPLMACCGYGGPPYNYNPNITCGNPEATACQPNFRFISWDGVHYTEAANSILASKILAGDYSNPKLKFSFFCDN